MKHEQVPYDEPLDPREAKRVAEEIRKRMLSEASDPQRLSEMAKSMGASPEVAEAALRAVRERQSRPRANVALPIALGIAGLLAFMLFGSFFLFGRDTVSAPVAPSPMVATDDLPPVAERGVAPPAPSLPLGDWQVQADVTVPSDIAQQATKDAEDLARLLDADNIRLEQRVLQNGGNFDHLLKTKDRALAGGVADKVHWNEVLRGNLAAKGLLSSPRPD
ncbi:MAG: hypothetical protein AB7F50_00615 [Fimbriimonadaceae bacterium]